jgi:hypothetical protein
LTVFDKNRLGAGRGREIAKLGAGELDEFWWRRRSAPALQ